MSYDDIGILQRALDDSSSTEAQAFIKAALQSGCRAKYIEPLENHCADIKAFEGFWLGGHAVITELKLYIARLKELPQDCDYLTEDQHDNVISEVAGFMMKGLVPLQVADSFIAQVSQLHQEHIIELVAKNAVQEILGTLRRGDANLMFIQCLCLFEFVIYSKISISSNWLLIQIDCLFLFILGFYQN